MVLKNIMEDFSFFFKNIHGKYVRYKLYFKLNYDIGQLATKLMLQIWSSPIYILHMPTAEYCAEPFCHA